MIFKFEGGCELEQDISNKLRTSLLPWTWKRPTWCLWVGLHRSSEYNETVSQCGVFTEQQCFIFALIFSVIFIACYNLFLGSVVAISEDASGDVSQFLYTCHLSRCSENFAYFQGQLGFDMSVVRLLSKYPLDGIKIGDTRNRHGLHKQIVTHFVASTTLATTHFQHIYLLQCLP
jgi:hypothetical protein